MKRLALCAPGVRCVVLRVSPGPGGSLVRDALPVVALQGWPAKGLPGGIADTAEAACVEPLVVEEGVIVPGLGCLPGEARRLVACPWDPSKDGSIFADHYEALERRLREDAPGGAA